MFKLEVYCSRQPYTFWFWDKTINSSNNYLSPKGINKEITPCLVGQPIGRLTVLLRDFLTYSRTPWTELCTQSDYDHRVWRVTCSDLYPSDKLPVSIPWYPRCTIRFKNKQHNNTFWNNFLEGYSHELIIVSSIDIFIKRKVLLVVHDVNLTVITIVSKTY